MQTTIKKITEGSVKDGTLVVLGEMKALTPDEKVIAQWWGLDPEAEMPAEFANHRAQVVKKLRDQDVHHPLTSRFKKTYRKSKDREASESDRAAAAALLAGTWQEDYAAPLGSRSKWGELSPVIARAKADFREVGRDPEKEEEALREYAKGILEDDRARAAKLRKLAGK